MIRGFHVKKKDGNVRRSFTVKAEIFAFWWQLWGEKDSERTANNSTRQFYNAEFATRVCFRQLLSNTQGRMNQG